MRLIDADSIQYEPMLSAKGNGMYDDVMVAYKSQIDDLPTIEERKEGHWISLDDFRGKYNTCGYKCSECSEHSDYEENYCPNCGTIMVNTTCGADMRETP